MNWLEAFFKWIGSWFTGPPGQFKTLRMEELPQKLNPNVMYVLGEGENLWFVVMLCPCGCGEKLQMSLLSEANPRWRLIEHNDGSVSLEPSIWRRVGCKSHFFLRRGKVDWCRTLNHSTTSAVTSSIRKRSDTV